MRKGSAKVLKVSLKIVQFIEVSAFIFVWIDATTKKNKKCINSLIFIYICMVHPVRDCEMTYCPISAVEIGTVV